MGGFELLLLIIAGFIGYREAYREVYDIDE